MSANPEPVEMLEQLLDAGLSAHQAGQLEAAEALYRRVLARHRSHFDAMQLLGVCLHQRGDFAGAERQLRAALKLRPGSARVHLNYGNALRELGREAEALASYARAGALDPTLDLAHYNAGAALEQAGRHAEALERFERALACRPTPEACTGRANCLLALGRVGEAVEGYRAALGLDPNHDEACANLGAVLAAQQRFDEALPFLERAVARNATHVGANLNLAMIHNIAGRSAEALRASERVVDSDAAGADLLYQHACALEGMQRSAAALDALERAHARAPAHLAVRLALTSKLARRLDRVDEAFDLLRGLRRDMPGDARVLVNLSVAHTTTGELAQARACLQEALAIDPNVAMGRLNLGMLDLLEGKLESGWRGLEARWEPLANRIHRRDYPEPMWLGQEDVAGSTLFTYHEQGLGDTLQFARYLPLLAARGCRVVFEVPLTLLGLMRRSLPADIEIQAYGAGKPAFDRHCPLLSLPLAFRTTLSTIPAPVPYVYADPQRVAAWRGRLGDVERIRIGLAWAGNPDHANDAQRSIALAALRGLFDAAARGGAGRVEFIALQNHLRPGDREIVAWTPSLHYYGGVLEDFDDTAALVELCDLVISVDSAPAHLAGAMGKPVWVLLPFVAEWRWLLDRHDNPWYPTARLFRQSAVSQWAPTIAQASDELERWLASRQAGARGPGRTDADSRRAEVVAR